MRHRYFDIISAIMKAKLKHMGHGAWAALKLAWEKFLGIDGTERAGAFAFNAFFSLFPLIVLAVTIISFFVERKDAAQFVINYAQSHIPLNGEMRKYIFSTITGVVQARREAGLAAFLMLLWAAPQFLGTLIQASNRAWGEKGERWWHLPVKSMALLIAMGLTVLIGMGVPALVKVANRFFPSYGFFSWAYALTAFFLPWLVFFLNMSLFYQLAPRRRTHFSEVWISALCATALLQAAQRLFVIYLTSFATLNAIYGAFGGIMALLLWIYLSGCIFIFCACLCASQQELRTAARCAS